MSEMMSLRADEISSIRLELTVEPVALDAIEVQVGRRCEAGIGADVQDVWEEARKALSLQITSQQQTGYLFELERYERLLRPDGRRTLREKRSRFSRLAAESFRGPPPEQLAKQGFFDTTGETVYVWGPTAEALLSPAFLDTHCFSVTRNTREVLIGLQFQPLPGRTVTDIRGTLWLDEKSATLRSVEFTYVNLPASAPGSGYGGRAHFERLATGGLFVREWWIRSPVVESIVQSVLGAPVEMEHLTALFEEGGSVLNVKDATGETLAAPAAQLAWPFSIQIGGDHPVALAAISRTRSRMPASWGLGEEITPSARIYGQVVDAADGKPLGNVNVALTEINRRVQTDARGLFALSRVPAGEYQLVTELPDRPPVIQRVNLDAAVTYDLTIRVPPRVIALPELDVVVTPRTPWLDMQGFYDRRHRGGANGHFIERADIEVRKPATVTDLFQDLPAVKVMRSGPGRATVWFNRQIKIGPQPGCEPDLYVDGTRRRSPGAGAQVTDWDMIPVSTIEAIEIYVGAATPLSYSNPCGVILIWLRRGASDGVR
jgi:hypothetical protein